MKPIGGLISAYGGSLTDLRANSKEFNEVLGRARRLRSLQLTPRSMCLLELLATGAFSPLDRFLGEASYHRVLEEMRLEDETLFPVPVTMSVMDLNGVKIGEEVALRSPTNNLVAWMRVEEIFPRDRESEARVWGTEGAQHHFADLNAEGSYCLSGPLKVVELPMHSDFPEFRRTPQVVRQELEGLGKSEVIAFQSSGWTDRVQNELTRRAASKDIALLIQPVISYEDRGDADQYLQLSSYVSRLEQAFHASSAVVSLLPLGTPFGGARELIWRLIVARNYGATHLLVSEFDSSRCVDLQAMDVQETGVQVLETEALPPKGRRSLSVAARPGAARSFVGSPTASHPPGFCIWFTGLPSSGKSTVAQNLSVLLMEHGRQVTMLDGDVVRTHLSRGLGFTREDRDTNVRRIGFVASEIVRHHGAVICAAVSPYRSTRADVRSMMREGSFVEVFVDTPADVCELRDVKGYYAKARLGEIKGFTGVDDPYEAPLNPEFSVDTTARSAKENAALIVQYLCGRGLLMEAPDAWRTGSTEVRADRAAGGIGD